MPARPEASAYGSEENDVFISSRKDLPYFVFAFEKLGHDGFGPARNKFVVKEVLCEASHEWLALYRTGDSALRRQPIQLCVDDLMPRIERGLAIARRLNDPPKLRILFQSPTEIRREGKPLRELSLADLVRSLLRRLANLTYFYCGHELSIDFHTLIGTAERCRKLSSDLRWRSQHRRSGSQRRRIPMGGLIGWAEYRIPDMETLEILLPYLVLGERLHVGKGCVMGLGRYEISISSDAIHIPAG